MILRNYNQTIYLDESTQDVNAKKREEESQLLKSISQSSALHSAAELAKGFRYIKALRTGWRPPAHISKQSDEEAEQVRKKRGIVVEGDQVPAGICSFVEMKLPRAILNALKARNIVAPTLIQMQGLPVALSGRDMIGIASTGSGKTLTFVLPLVMFCLEQELSMRFDHGEGPYGLIIVPSRELAKQIYDVIIWLFNELEAESFPLLRCGLAIGGMPFRDQAKDFEK